MNNRTAPSVPPTTHAPPSRKRPRWPAALAISLLLVLLIGAYLFIPQNIRSLASSPHPAQGYDEAVQRIEALQAQETGFNPVCRTQFMTYSQKMAQVIVMTHGYTNCPEQFRALGKQFYTLGYNVLIAPLPHHGLADRLTDEQSQLTAEEVVSYADEVVDIAQGLGDHVTMIGISGGGVTTAWAAQTRSDLDLAVIISPAFGYYIVPTPLTVPAMNYYLAIPDSYTWWDENLKDKVGPDYGYPRYSTHALAQLLRLGFAVGTRAQEAAPAAGSILVITNANDQIINNTLIYTVTGYWRDHGANLRTYEFDASLQLSHDLIDPSLPDQKTDIVYPKLVELITP